MLPSFIYFPLFLLFRTNSNSDMRTCPSFRYFVFLPFLLVIFQACEEHVQIDLRESVSVPVIEGVLTDKRGNAFVKLSSTVDYFHTGYFPVISGADVQILRDEGPPFVMIEESPGLYINYTARGIPGRHYTLRVAFEDEVYTGVSTMPSKVPIDSLLPEYFSGTRFSEEGFLVHCYFTDPAEQKNYYRLRVLKGNFQSNYYYLLDDRLNNGMSIHYFLFGKPFLPGDTAVVELMNLDFATFDYYNSLSSVVASSTQGIGTTPANPNSNLFPEVLGYFGAMAVDRDTIVFPEPPE